MFQNRVIRGLPVWAAYLAGAAPLIWLVATGFTGGLGADPAKTIEHELGLWALRFLVTVLAVTPVWKLTGLNFIIYRRALGLIAFAYVVLHLLAYVVLDYQFAWGQIAGDIVKRPYITIGMAAFLALVPLAITSNAMAIRRLGSAAWKRLHRLVYAIVPLGAVHYLLLTKTWRIEPVIYLAVIFVLLALRHASVDLRARSTRRRPVTA